MKPPSSSDSTHQLALLEREAEARARRGVAIMQGAGVLFGLLLSPLFAVIYLGFSALSVSPFIAALATILVLMGGFGLFLKLLFLWRAPKMLPARTLNLTPLFAAAQARQAAISLTVEAHPLPAGLPPSLSRLHVKDFLAYRHDLERMGFISLGGFHILDPNGSLDHSVYDVWAHPVYLCYGAIAQDVLLIGLSRPARLFISSGLGDHWWFYSTDFPINRANFLLRTPRTAWTRHPRTGAEALLRYHLERREDLTKIIDRQAEPSLSLEAYINGEAIQFAAQRNQISGKSISVAWYEALFFSYIPHQEWMGEATLFRD